MIISGLHKEIDTILRESQENILLTENISSEEALELAETKFVDRITELLKLRMGYDVGSYKEKPESFLSEDAIFAYTTAYLEASLDGSTDQLEEFDMGEEDEA